MTANIYSFQRWKEFSLEQPEETIYTYLRNVLDNTNLKGKLKHNNQNVFKVFSLIITHNYGHLVYEFTHFLYFINKMEIPYYKVVVSDPCDVRKIIVNETNHVKNGKIEFSINNKLFGISIKRIPFLLIFFDFLEELIGTTNVIKFSEQSIKIINQKEINILSNNISKLIYENIKNIIPSAHTQSFGHLISAELMSFKNEKFDNLNSDDIDDEFIFEFWKKVNSKNKKFSLKTFRLVFELCLKFKKALQLAPTLIQNEISLNNHENTLYQKKFYSNEINNDDWDKSNQNYETSIDYIANESSKSEEAIKFFEILQKEGINLVKKNEIEDLRIFSLYPEFLNKIALSYMRNIVFSNIQNKLIEAERRNNLKKSFEQLQGSKNNFHYKIYLNKNKNLSLYLQKLKNIIFSYLWQYNSKYCFNLINEYLNFEEKKVIKTYVRETMKKEDINLSKFAVILKNLIEKPEFNKSKTFNELKSKIKQFDSFRKIFRRKGLSNDKNLKREQNLFKTSNFINIIISNMKHFRESMNNITELDNQFDKDFENFNKSFFLIHGDK